MPNFKFRSKNRTAAVSVPRLTLAAVISISGLLFPSFAHAQNTWIGQGGSNLWSDSGNWEGGNIPPLGGNTSLLVTFTGSANLTNFNDRDSNGTQTGTFNLNSLVFAAADAQHTAAGAYNINGATLRFNGASTLQVNTASPITINSALSLASSLTLGTYAGGVPIAATSPIGTLTINGAIGGTSSTNLTTRLNSLTLTGGTTPGNPIGGFLIGGIAGPPASVARAFVTANTYAVDRVTVGASNGEGALTVSGIGTSITAVNAINVASTGNGTLTIQNGGVVSGNTIFMGISANLVGNATVTGNGSRLLAGTTNLDVAYASNTQSTLTLQNGGSATAGNVFIGGVDPNGTTGASGTIVVNGPGRDSVGNPLTNIFPGSSTPGATLQATNIIVGNNNTGALNISNGGTVETSLDVFVGLNFGSAGSITIDSAGAAGSALTVGGVLSLGGRSPTPTTPMNGGPASITLTNGATLNAVTGATFYDQSSITASDSTLNLAGMQSASGSGGSVQLTNSTLNVGSGNNNTVFIGVISGSGNNFVNKIGATTLTLAGANTYTGDTNVNGGSLLVNGSTNAGQAVNVNAGILGGTGTVGNIIESSASGGIISPGQGTGSIGTLHATSLLLTGDNTTIQKTNFAFDLDLSSVTSDQLALSGTLSKSSSASSYFKFTFSATGSIASGMFDTFTLATFAQPTNASTKVMTTDLHYDGLASGLTGTFGNDGQGYWNGQFTVSSINAQVPEPGSLFLLGLGGTTFLSLTSRRRRSSCRQRTNQI